MTSGGSRLEMSQVSIPEAASFVERTPLELAVLRSNPKVYDGCDHCPACLSLLKVSLGKNPVTSLYSATSRDATLQSVISELLQFRISSEQGRVNMCKRGLCRFHALHYKLYVHRFNIDTMIAIKHFDDTGKVLDDATIEQVFANLESNVEACFESCYKKWIKDLQQHILEKFSENVEKEFVCLKAELRNKLHEKERQLEKRIKMIQEEQDDALDAAEARLQVQMQTEKFKKVKTMLDDYGRVYHTACSSTKGNILHVMKKYAKHEKEGGRKVDDELRVQYLRKVDKARERQDRELAIWRGKLDAHRKQQYAMVRDTTNKFNRGKHNRLQRLRDVQASEAKKIFEDFRKHAVHMRSLAMRRGVSVQTTTLRPITPTICGYLLLLLKRALPPNMQSRTIMRDGEPLHDSKAGTVLAQFAAWLYESPELVGLSGRDVFRLLDTRKAGRVTSTDLQQFVHRHNILLQPSILFNTLPKEEPGVIQLDDFLMAMRPVEFEHEICVTELLYTWQKRQPGSDFDRDEQEQLLGQLRQVAVRVLEFLDVREPPYDPDDDVMFYRVHNFSQQKTKLTHEVRNWDAAASIYRLGGQAALNVSKQSSIAMNRSKSPGGAGAPGGPPATISPVEQRTGFMHTGRYEFSVPRLTIAPPDHSPNHRGAVSDTHGQRYYRANLESSALDFDRRVVLDATEERGWDIAPAKSGLAARTGFLHFGSSPSTARPPAASNLFMAKPQLIDSSVIDTHESYGQDGSVSDRRVLRRSTSATGKDLTAAGEQNPTAAGATPSSASGTTTTGPSHLIRKAQAYHDVATKQVFGNRGSSKQLGEIGTVPSGPNLHPHKSTFNFEYHSRPIFAVQKIGKVNTNQGSFLWDPISKTREELAKAAPARTRTSSPTVTRELLKFAQDRSRSPSRLGSPARGREGSHLVRSGSTVETHALETRDGIDNQTLETDVNHEVLSTDKAGNKKRRSKSPHQVMRERQQSQDFNRRLDRNEMSLRRKQSRDRRVVNKKKHVDKFHEQQEEAHSSVASSRIQSKAGTESPRSPRSVGGGGNGGSNGATASQRLSRMSVNAPMEKGIEFSSSQTRTKGLLNRSETLLVRFNEKDKKQASKMEEFSPEMTPTTEEQNNSETAAAKKATFSFYPGERTSSASTSTQKMMVAAGNYTLSGAGTMSTRATTMNSRTSRPSFVFRSTASMSESEEQEASQRTASPATPTEPVHFQQLETRKSGSSTQHQTRRSTASAAFTPTASASNPNSYLNRRAGSTVNSATTRSASLRRSSSVTSTSSRQQPTSMAELLNKNSEAMHRRNQSATTQRGVATSSGRPPRAPPSMSTQGRTSSVQTVDETDGSVNALERLYCNNSASATVSHKMNNASASYSYSGEEQVDQRSERIEMERRTVTAQSPAFVRKSAASTSSPVVSVGLGAAPTLKVPSLFQMRKN